LKITSQRVEICLAFVQMENSPSVHVVSLLILLILSILSKVFLRALCLSGLCPVLSLTGLCPASEVNAYRHSSRLIPVIPICPVCPIYPVPLRLNLLLAFRRGSLALSQSLRGSAAGGLRYELNKDLRLSAGPPGLDASRRLLSRILRQFLAGCFHQTLNLIGWDLVFFEFTLRDVIKRSFKTSHNRHDLLLFAGIVLLRFKHLDQRSPHPTHPRGGHEQRHAGGSRSKPNASSCREPLAIHNVPYAHLLCH